MYKKIQKYLEVPIQLKFRRIPTHPRAASQHLHGWNDVARWLVMWVFLIEDWQTFGESPGIIVACMCYFLQSTLA